MSPYVDKSEYFDDFDWFSVLTTMRFSDDEFLRSHDLFVCFYYSAFVAVFTNLGASGRFGPTSIGSHYRGKDHDGQVTLASGIQKWTVPISGEYQVEAIGASGGYDN